MAKTAWHALVARKLAAEEHTYIPGCVAQARALHCRVPAESESAVLTSAALLPQPTADSTQHSQTSSEPPPPPFSTLASCRITPHPSVIPDASGLPQTSLPLGAHSRQPSSNQPVTGRRSLETAKPVGVAEPWQVLDGDADLTAVWNKYQEVFYGDYKPVPSTYRRWAAALIRITSIVTVCMVCWRPVRQTFCNTHCQYFNTWKQSQQ